MGFCRRCGDIVIGPRCKCGGTAVAPVVKWNQGDNQEAQDRWSRTYVTREKSPTRPTTRIEETAVEAPFASAPSPAKRFPRPDSAAQSTPVSLGSRVSAHIASTTASRPPSPLKYSTSVQKGDAFSSAANAAAGILPNPHGSELAKVYGSVLQPKETLSSYHCALCASPFAPDATIYPDPNSLTSSGSDASTDSGTRFLCRSCFTMNGGSKGECPSCCRPVLILKSEGGFVENGGRVWHKKCFCCEGCSKNIGDNPMVDLLGRPSCADCFETCLQRPSRDSPQRRGNGWNEEKQGNLGGTRRSDRERESSPALEELEQRLGIVRSRENTPVKEDQTGRSTTDTPKLHSPLALRYMSRSVGSAEASPIVGRLVARVRTDSDVDVSARPISMLVSDGNPSSHAMRRYESPEVDPPPNENGSPVSTRRKYRLKSPELDEASSDGSPVPRRTNRLKSPDYDVFNSSPISRIDSSPRYGSPITSKKPTEEAIEEMKKRFLKQASPAETASASNDNTSPNPTTPTRRSTSRARVSLPPDPTLDANANDSAPPRSDRTGPTKLPRVSTSPTLRSSPSVPSLRSSLRQDRIGETDYTLRRDRTGDAEVESLLGTIPTTMTGDLIDLSPDNSMSSIISGPELTGSMSKIPLSVRSTVHTGSIRTELGLRTSMSNSSLKQGYRQSIPSTPDLAGDSSDTTQSSAPPTPPSISPPHRNADYPCGPKQRRAGSGPSNHERTSRPSDVLASTPTSKSKNPPHILTTPSPTPLSPDARCTKCNLPLFSTKHGGKFVTVPEEPSSSGVPPKTYHTSCFRCKMCGGVFEEREGGRAVFVRGEEGACHVECAPPEKVKVRQVPSMIPRSSNQFASQPSAWRTNTALVYSTPSSSRYERPPPSAPPTTTTSTFPPARFGASSSCPGCDKAVALMERGVVPGPHGTRWHAACLICGGKEAKGRRKEIGKPGCGKKLDSAAKTDRDGHVWCRECLLLLPVTTRQSPSPVRRPLAASHTGGRGIAPQNTGTTTIARQFTGLGGSSDAALMRQLTGGGLSPTRQLTSSPTKLHDGPRPGAGRYPRPKSAIGMRSAKGEGEGRGMFLVRQLTGGKPGGISENDYGL
ncbi:hypothetical protein AcV5_004393 [Taiwanofungus camphoratus]|nr:hypothetical protein AcV5_004393 [Antrodia cinnamomea]